MFEGELVIKEAFIAEDTEKRFSTEQRRWIRRRDGGAYVPILNGRCELIDLRKVETNDLQVHHIHPISHLRDHCNGVEPNHPLNAYTLPPKFHCRLHRDCNDWIQRYDEFFTSFAIINSFDYLEKDEFPFREDFGDEIEEMYYLLEMFDNEFIDFYRSLKDGC